MMMASLMRTFRGIRLNSTRNFSILTSRLSCQLKRRPLSAVLTPRTTPKWLISNKSPIIFKSSSFSTSLNGTIKICEEDSTHFRVSPAIREAVNSGEPVVALETAILTHGMPFPTNIETALRVQTIIREEGGIPATIGVLKGQLVVGLSEEEIRELGAEPNGPKVVKISRRDFPRILSSRELFGGGTTVSGTIIGAVRAGIPIFVTGGLGGVHRGAEQTFDISADLRELGRSQVSVISSGVKSILDIGKTLEYLETEGVCVCVLKKGASSSQSKRIPFPAFFTSESHFPAPFSVQDEIEAAKMIHSLMEFGLKSGLLLAIPIPKEFEASGEEIERAIRDAEELAAKEGVSGKEVTPYLLGKVNKLTGGKSLEANRRLIENNAKIGARIAIELSKLRGNELGRKGQKGKPNPESSFESKSNLTNNFSDSSDSVPRAPQKGRPVVIGGSSYDLIMSLEEPKLIMTPSLN